MFRVKFIAAVSACSLFTVLLVGVVYAGSLSPSASPAATFYTLADIYTRLTTNATATEAGHAFAPSGAPAASLYTLKQIYEAIPTIDASKVLSGTTYLGVAGSISSRTLSAANDTVAAGYYAATTLSAVDSDLAAGNIKSNTQVFGMTGSYVGYPGTGWTPNGSGDGSTPLNQANCAAASGWYWFEDGNGDGDATDPEDGVCVQGTHQAAAGSWNGDDSATQYDNSYIADYTCSGNFPNGTVATYSGTGAGVADTTWNAGDCALCQADCYDGKKDLPGQGGYTRPKYASDGINGPVTPEVLKNWKGTRLPASNDFFGFCGRKDGFIAGDNYSTSCSSDVLYGGYGGMVGRTGECLDLSDSGAWEWLSEQGNYTNARLAGNAACSNFHYGSVYSDRRFRAVFRP
ncbi:MAG: hypothetical protein PHX87_05415 [Candidatus Peribacteraceae bacterium]|nr:hypothetical protein [Candidatus Peribacteraceae bacterium]